MHSYAGYENKVKSNLLNRVRSYHSEEEIFEIVIPMEDVIEFKGGDAPRGAEVARELHDVVAHSLSVVVVQAQAADRVLEGDQRSAREALAAIDSTGRQALVEMRRLVGMLRQDGEPSLGPQPGVGQLSALLEQVREAGLPVELIVEGSPRTFRPASTSRPTGSSKRR